MKRAKRWRWSGRKGFAGAGRPKPRALASKRGAPAWLGPVLVVVVAAVAGYTGLTRAYGGVSAVPASPSGSAGVVLEVAVFDGGIALEAFLKDFLPWARERGAAGWDGPGVEVLEMPGEPLRYAVVWGPFPVAEAGKRMAELKRRWGLSPRIAP